MVKDFNKKSGEMLERLAIRATTWIGSTQSLFVHTFFFLAIFLFYFIGVELQKILLIVTTIVSYEAIYLSIFIQMSVNRQQKSLEEVALDVEEIHEDVEDIHEDVEDISKDVDEIQKDVDEIQEDVGEIQEDVEEIQEDVEGIEKDVDEIQKDVDEIQEGVDEIQEDVDDISEEMAEDGEHEEIDLAKIEKTLKALVEKISEIKKQNKKKTVKEKK